MTDNISIVVFVSGSGAVLLELCRNLWCLSRKQECGLYIRLYADKFGFETASNVVKYSSVIDGVSLELFPGIFDEMSPSELQASLRGMDYACYLVEEGGITNVNGQKSVIREPFFGDKLFQSLKIEGIKSFLTCFPDVLNIADLIGLDLDAFEEISIQCVQYSFIMDNFFSRQLLGDLLMQSNVVSGIGRSLTWPLVIKNGFGVRTVCAEDVGVCISRIILGSPSNIVHYHLTGDIVDAKFMNTSLSKITGVPILVGEKEDNGRITTDQPCSVLDWTGYQIPLSDAENTAFLSSYKHRDILTIQARFKYCSTSFDEDCHFEISGLAATSFTTFLQKSKDSIDDILREFGCVVVDNDDGSDDMSVIQGKWEIEQAFLRTQLREFDDYGWTYDDCSSSSSNTSSIPRLLPYPLKHIAGVDISFIKTDPNTAVAALVVLSFPTLDVIYEKCEVITLSEPYISGFLAFRECTPLLSMIKQLKMDRPEIDIDAILVDGNGVLHPMGFGAASHLGVLVGIPTIGVGKKLCCVDGLDRITVAQNARNAFTSGSNWMQLVGSSGRIWGAAVRSTGKSVDPIFVSVGHRFSLQSAIELARCCCIHRIPEPIRQADLRSREYVRGMG